MSDDIGKASGRWNVVNYRTLLIPILQNMSSEIYIASVIRPIVNDYEMTWANILFLSKIILGFIVQDEFMQHLKKEISVDCNGLRTRQIWILWKTYDICYLKLFTIGMTHAKLRKS